MCGSGMRQRTSSHRSRLATGAPRPGTTARCCAAAVLMALAWLASAQPVLRPVEQGVEDRTATSTSQRVVQRDLRSPAGFDRLYRIEGRITDPAWIRAGVREGMYARVQGGVVAVFPQSAYRQLGPGRTLVEVPASTQFLMGDTQRMLGLAPAEGQSNLPAPVALQLDQRVDMSAGMESPVVTREIAPSIWNDESYRRLRIAAILRGPQQGAKAGRSR